MARMLHAFSTVLVALPSAASGADRRALLVGTPLHPLFVTLSPETFIAVVEAVDFAGGAFEIWTCGHCLLRLCQGSHDEL